MHKSFDGLHAMVLSRLGEDPRGGAVFCFINRSHTLIKLLLWDGCPVGRTRGASSTRPSLGQALAAGPLAAIQGLYRIENGIRPTAVGKMGWLSMGGETTGQRAAIIYTLVECAKRHGHKPEAYLADVPGRIPAMTNKDDLGELLPSRWQPAPVPDTRPRREDRGRGLWSL